MAAGAMRLPQKLHSWRLVCSAISIFTAVPMFQAVDDVLKAYLLREPFERHPVATNFALGIAWYLVLQALLAGLSRAGPCGCLEEFAPSGREREEGLRGASLGLRCWAKLFGQATGFASISAWCSLQQVFGDQDTFTDSLVGVALVTLLASVSLWCLFRASGDVREHLSAAQPGRGRAGGEVDALWGRGSEETEDDIFGLTVSFLAVQCVRLAIHGTMPSARGNLPVSCEVSPLQVAELVLAGVCFAGAGLLLPPVTPLAELGRIYDWFRLACNFVFSWCVLFAAGGWLAQGVGTEDGRATGKLLLPMVITLLSFALIFAVEQLAAGPRLDQSLGALIGALGILIGFSWEDCFDVAAGSLAASADLLPDVLTKLLLSTLLCGMAVPAWRWYILPLVFSLETEIAGGAERDAEKADGYLPLLGGGGSPQEAAFRGEEKAAAESLARELALSRIALLAAESRAERAEEALERKSGAANGSVDSVNELREKLISANKRMAHFKRQAADALEAEEATKDEAARAVAAEAAQGAQQFQQRGEVEELRAALVAARQDLGAALDAKDQELVRLRSALEASEAHADGTQKALLQVAAEKSELEARVRAVELDNRDLEASVREGDRLGDELGGACAELQARAAASERKSQELEAALKASEEAAAVAAMAAQLPLRMVAPDGHLAAMYGAGSSWPVSRSAAESFTESPQTPGLPLGASDGAIARPVFYGAGPPARRAHSGPTGRMMRRSMPAAPMFAPAPLPVPRPLASSPGTSTPRGTAGLQQAKTLSPASVLQKQSAGAGLLTPASSLTLPVAKSLTAGWSRPRTPHMSGGATPRAAASATAQVLSAGQGLLSASRLDTPAGALSAGLDLLSAGRPGSPAGALSPGLQMGLGHRSPGPPAAPQGVLSM